MILSIRRKNQDIKENTPPCEANTQRKQNIQHKETNTMKNDTILETGNERTENNFGY